MLSQPTKDYEYKFIELLQEYPKYCVLNLGYLDPGAIKNESCRAVWVGATSRIGKNTSDYESANIVSELIVENGLAAIYSGLVDVMPEAVVAKIQEMSFYRNVDRLNGEIATALRQGDTEKVTLLKERLYEEQLGTNTGMKSAEEVSNEFIERIQEGSVSVPWHIGGMDGATGGKERQTLTIIAARPGMGKTAIALQAARNDAKKNRVGFFQLEMGATSMWARVACPAVGVVWKDVIAGNITADKKLELIAESKEVAKRYGQLFIDDTPGLTTSEIYQKAIQNSLDVVYVDHLWIIGDDGDKEVQRLGDITMRLKNMAKALDIPVVLLVQLSRNVEKRKDKIPVLSDLRDSGKIEETADNVLMMYRPSYYDPNLPDTTEVWVRKFRNGEANVKVNLSFDPVSLWFDSPQKVKVGGGYVPSKGYRD